ncbi:MAG: hypothetical protein WC941_08370 [Candidatus Bathyarchaeia archaeon]
MKRINKLTINQKWVITTIIAVLGLFLGISAYMKNLPAPNVDIKIYSGKIETNLNENKTIYTGLKTTFPALIVNTGNVPVNIVICKVYLRVDGKPNNLSDVPLSQIAYLKPNDSFEYNFTNYFDVSMPVSTTSPKDIINYLLLLGYQPSNNDEIKFVWIDPIKIS